MEYDPSNMFTIMPMSQKFRLAPGETYEGEIMVVNPAAAENDFEYRVSVTPYAVTGSDYAVDLATRSTQSAIVDWIKLENTTGKVSPNGTDTIKFTITVPEDAPGGGQYATISVGSNAKSVGGDGVAVKNIFEMASIIYGEVEGDIHHEGAILENRIPGFSTTTPITVAATIENTGNVHDTATIAIKATNFFTGEVILPTEDNEGKYVEVIMPDTERFITREINNLPAVGVVHIEQSVYYLGASSVEVRNVIICPIWFMLLVLVTLGALVGAVVYAVRRHRKKKQVI